MTPYYGEDNCKLPASTQEKVHTLVVTGNMLLGDALESLLAGAFALPVQRVMAASTDALLAATDHYQPEVIVLEEGLIDDSAIHLLSQLPDYGNIRLILVDPRENQLYVYDRYQVFLTQAADLKVLIENSPTYSQ